jgi:hypothetical protein
MATAVDRSLKPVAALHNAWTKEGWMRCRWMVVAAVLLTMFFQAVGHARHSSITFDEGPHLAVGYATLRTGDLRLQPVHIHPPLANVIAAWPLLLQDDLPDPRSVQGWGRASLSAVTDAVVWQYSHPERLQISARVPIILMTMLLAALVFKWSSDLFGTRAGVVALVLCAFDPNIIAHGSLVTTDMAVTLFGTATLFLAFRQLRRITMTGVAGAGIALGLALASKVSAISLVPAVSVIWLLGLTGVPWKRRIGILGTATALAFMTLWAAYGFELRTLSGFSLPVPAATHFEIYSSLQEHYGLGHPSFLVGRNSDRGWLEYFPAAFLLKTPLPLLILLVMAIAYEVRKWLAIRSLDALLSQRLLSLGFFPLLYGVTSLFSSVNIGYRHLLPLLPFLFVAASGAVQLGKSRAVLSYGLGALATLHAATTLSLYPHYLTFFNALSGGPQRGYNYLVDSNLDWGQNLWQLRDRMRANDVSHVSYAHFSPARPSAYGIDASLLPPSPSGVSFAPMNPKPGMYAIGATVLQGVYTPDVNTYAWFRTHPPSEVLGHALFLYEVEQRAKSEWAVVCADPVPVLSHDAIRAGLGQPDIRLISLDCTQSEVYPGGSGPGVWAGSPGISPPLASYLDLSARRESGEALYDLYRVLEPPAPPSEVGRLSAVNGTLAFAGFEPLEAPLLPGETAEFRTYWHVSDVPNRPLSLMAHLVGPSGVVAGVGDGLGVQIDQWRTGDTIVQLHRMEIPVDAAPGTYALETGAYWLDTLERWSMRLEDGSVQDHIPLQQLRVEE